MNCFLTCGWVSDGIEGWTASLVCGIDKGVAEGEMDILWLFSIVSVVTGLIGGVTVDVEEAGRDGCMTCLVVSFGMVLLIICWEGGIVE